MTTTSQQSAIAFALASYARLETVQDPVVIRTDLSKQPLVRVKATKGSRTVKVQPQVAQPAAAVEPVAKPATPSPNGGKAVVALPAAGTIGAKAFTAMMNRSKSREESIIAIASYIGYDNSISFGENEMAAKQAAKAELRPVSAEGPTRAERRTAQNSVKGYVAGMPDALRKQAMDLAGRIQLSVDEINRLETENKRTDLSSAERDLNSGLIDLETERLEVIRADLAKLIG